MSLEWAGEEGSVPGARLASTPTPFYMPSSHSPEPRGRLASTPTPWYLPSSHSPEPRGRSCSVHVDWDRASPVREVTERQYTDRLIQDADEFRQAIEQKDAKITRMELQILGLESSLDQKHLMDMQTQLQALREELTIKNAKLEQVSVQAEEDRRLFIERTEDFAQRAAAQQQHDVRDAATHNNRAMQQLEECRAKLQQRELQWARERDALQHEATHFRNSFESTTKQLLFLERQAKMFDEKIHQQVRTSLPNLTRTQACPALTAVEESQDLALADKALQLNIASAHLQSTKVRAAHKIVCLWFNMQISPAFVTWTKNAIESADSRRKLLKAARRLVKSSLSKALTIFVLNHRRSQRKRRILKRAVAKWSKSLLPRSWQEWRDRVQATRRACQVMAKVIGRWRLNTLNKSFNCWMSLRWSRVCLRQVLRKCVGHWLNQCIAGPFESLRDHCRTQQRAKLKLAQAIGRWRMRATGRVVGTWKDRVKQQKRSFAMISKVVRHWRKRALARPFETWRVHAKQIEQGKALLRKVVGRMQNGAVWRAFDTWLTFNSHLQHARHNLEVSV